MLDACGVEKAQVIGCSFIFELIERAPERMLVSMPMQPIGHDESNPGAFGPQTWEPWGKSLVEDGATFDAATLDRFGHAANLHLSLAVHNFGVLECTPFSDAARELFPGAPEIRDGSMRANDKPGWGVDVNEELAATYPWPDTPLRGGWAHLRRRDGTILRQ